MHAAEGVPVNNVVECVVRNAMETLWQKHQVFQAPCSPPRVEAAPCAAALARTPASTLASKMQPFDRGLHRQVSTTASLTGNPIPDRRSHPISPQAPDSKVSKASSSPPASPPLYFRFFFGRLVRPGRGCGMLCSFCSGISQHTCSARRLGPLMLQMALKNGRPFSTRASRRRPPPPISCLMMVHHTPPPSPAPTLALTLTPNRMRITNLTALSCLWIAGPLRRRGGSLSRFSR